MVEPPPVSAPSRRRSRRGTDEAAAPTLRSRVLSPRTGLSIVVTIAVLSLAVWRSGIDWRGTWREMSQATLGLYLLALAAYYASFAVRAVRWRLLLRNTGTEVPLGACTEIILASFFVNCVVPAKMGDLYRAVQLRSRQSVSGGRALGTIIAERLLDLFVLMGLLVIAGAVTFRDRVPRQLIPYFVGGLVLCALGVGVLGILTSGRGQRLLRYVPEAAVRRYESFRTGTVDAFGRWLAIIPLSVAVWGLEGARLGLVVLALGHGSDVGPAHFLLMALVAALLTTVPFLPGGLGLVEGGMIAVLTTITSVSRTTAASIALLDRSISFASIILVGGTMFLLFHARPARHRAAARHAAMESREASG